MAATQAEEDISRIVKEAVKGAGQIRITFKETGIQDIPYLLGMKRSDIVFMNEGDFIALTAVFHSKEWQHYNRTVEIAFTEYFDADWFIMRMRRALEKIELF